MSITPFPPAPLVTDDRATFNTKAFARVAADGLFVTEINLAIADIDDDVASASASAGTATTQAGIATTKAGLTAADALATAADRVQTGLDRASATDSAATASARAGDAAASAASVVRDGSGGVAGLTGYAINIWNSVKSFKSLLSFADLTEDRSHVLPNKSGTVALLDDVTTALSSANAYSDGLVVGAWDDRGSWSAVATTYPTTGGRGVGGLPVKGDLWTISAAGTLAGGVVVNIGDVLRAIVDTPGQAAANWAVVENNIGYVPENAANKRTSFQATPDDTHYASEKLVKDSLDGKAATNASTTGSANSLKSNATTGVMQIVGPAAGATRVMTVPDANATLVTAATLNGGTLPANVASLTAATLSQGPSIFVFDSLRMSVEHASGGTQTVLYTALNQPTFMNIIPAFNGSQVDASVTAGLHAMFTVNGVAKTQIMLGTYLGCVKNGELLSLPGQDPANTLNHDQFVAYARACGAGHHVMTNPEAAGLALWCRANSFQPRGNTNTGSAYDAAWETGVISGAGRTATGSGPASWRHNNSLSGISDLCGNVWEWSPGMRVNNGEINIITNNDAALNATDLSAGSASWKAIAGATGALVAPGTAGTVKYAVSGTTAYTLVLGSGAAFEGMTNPSGTPVGAAALALCKAYGLYPVASALGGTIATPAANFDIFYLNAAIEALPSRFGNWSHAAGAGLFTLDCNSPRAYASNSLGARPAFVS
jgi:hypothetical protein